MGAGCFIHGIEALSRDRYGRLRDMNPTGPHEGGSGNLVGRIFVEILRANLQWIVPKNCLIKPPVAEATALRPNVVLLDEKKLKQEPLWQQELIICNGNTVQLVVEVISLNRKDDYARKVEEYALLGIPEYWIVDYRGLGGIAFIGKPKQPTFTVCQLINDEYRQQQYILRQWIHFLRFPDLQLRLDDILPR